MRSRLRWAWLALGLAGCGGHTGRSGDDGPAVDGSSPGATGGGGASAGGGSLSAGGAASAGAANRSGAGGGLDGQPLGPCRGEVPGITCVPSCGVDLNSVDAPVCDDLGWHCAASHVDLTTCPPESCARTSPLCCDSARGVHVAATCRSDGTRSACPAGSHVPPAGEYCRPDGVDLASCQSGLECPMSGYECHSARGLCTCLEDTTWECVYLLL